MAVIQRPTKQGNATTYQGKVAAGYTKILASEVDADLDLIYSAWNQGVDTTNIKDGSIIGSKLAPGAVGTRELTDGGIQTVDIGDGQVTTPKIADGAVTAGKLVGGGVMGGDLTGTYPNPALGLIQNGILQLQNRGRLASTSPALLDLSINDCRVAGANASKPSWVVELHVDVDSFFVFRAPPGATDGTAYVQFAQIDAAGKLHVTLADASVARAQLAVNGVFGTAVVVPAPASFVLATGNVWTQYGGNIAITTRGGFVALHANTDLSVNGPTGGAIVYQRWLRDGAIVIQQRAFNVASTGGAYAPLPGIDCLDNACPAGAHTYVYQVNVNANMTVLSTSATTSGFLEAVEIG